MNTSNDILKRAKDSAAATASSANTKAQETLESVLTDFNRNLGTMLERLRGTDVNRAVRNTSTTVSQHPWLLASGLAIGIGIGIGAVLLTKNKQ